MSGILTGGGSFQESEQKTKDIAPSEFRALRQPFAQELARLLGGEIQNYRFAPGGGPSPFAQLTSAFQGVEDPSIFAAQLSPEEKALISGISAEGLGTAETAEAANLRRRIIAGEFLEPDARTREALQRPVLEAFEEARRGDLGAFTRAGQRVQESSPFFRSRALAERGLANALSDIEVGLREGERNRQFQAASQAEQLDATRAATQVQRLQATALPRLVEDLGIQRGIEEFNRRTQVLLAILGLTADVTAPTPGAFGSSFGLAIS